MGDGDHGWSAAEFVNLMRNALVRDEEGIILLAPSVPCEWLSTPARLEVRGASTAGGIVDYSLERNAGQLELEWSITRHPQQERLRVYLALPAKGRAGVILKKDRGRLSLAWTDAARAISKELTNAQPHIP